VQQEQHGDEGHDGHLLGNGRFQGVDGPFDEIGTVINGDDLHPGGQAGLQVLQLLLDGLDHGPGVFPVAHDDDAAHHLAFAVAFGQTPPQFRPQAHQGDVFHQDGGAPAVSAHRDIFHVGDGFDIAQAPHHVFGFGHFQDPAAGVLVGALDGLSDFSQGNAVGRQPIGVHHHLVLLDEAPHGGHFRHPRHGLELIAQVPVLDAPQLRQIVLAGGVLEDVLEDPAHAGGVGAQLGVDPGGEPAPDEVQVFQDPGAGPVNVGAVLKNDVNQGQAEGRIAPHHLGLGHGQHGGGEGVGHLVLHHQGRLLGEFGADDDLNVGKIGDGVHRQVIGGVNPPGGDQDPDEEDQIAVADAEFNKPGDHGRSVMRAGRGARGLEPLALPHGFPP
jgi:hypothetical protein